MKIKILILSSLLALAFFAINAYSQDDLQSADDYINASRGEVSIEPIDGEYSSPLAAREAQKGQKNKDILSVSLGGKLNSEAKDPQAARSQTSSGTAPAASQNQAVAALPASVDGTWSLELVDGMARNASLTLFQSGEAVFGTGSMNVDDSKRRQLAASGSVTGDEMRLDLVTLGSVSLYRLFLTVSGDLSSGSYTSFSPIAAPSNGTARGQRTAAP